MTGLNKKVKRTVEVSIDGRRKAQTVVVTLDPNHGTPQITFRPKGCRREYSLPISTVYNKAVFTDAKAKAEKLLKAKPQRRRFVRRGLRSLAGAR